MNGPGAIREGFLEEAMNTTESDAENDNNQHVSNTYYMPGTGLRVLTPVDDCIKQTPSRLACMEHLVPIFTSGNSDLLIPASLALYRPSLHTSLKQLSHSIPSESDLNSSPWSL